MDATSKVRPEAQRPVFANTTLTARLLGEPRDTPRTPAWPNSARFSLGRVSGEALPQSAGLGQLLAGGASHSVRARPKSNVGVRWRPATPQRSGAARRAQLGMERALPREPHVKGSPGPISRRGRPPHRRSQCCRLSFTGANRPHRRKDPLTPIYRTPNSYRSPNSYL